MSPQPYQPDYRPPSDGQERTDFQSLRSAPLPAEEMLYSTANPAPKGRDALSTDFQSLTSKDPKHKAPVPPRTITDTLIDALTPFMIFVMIYSVIFFLLDVRYIYTEVNDLGLRWVAFCFIIGVVALNRLIARDGSEESMLYMAALAFAIGMYTFMSTGAYEMGSVSRNFMNDNPYLATAFNMIIVIFIWWLTNRLTHECCVDENRTAGDVGILTGTARRFQSAPRTDTPKKKPAAKRGKEPIFGPMYVLEAFDPMEGYQPKEAPPQEAVYSLADRLAGRHPGISIFYFSVPVMFIFAIGLRVVQQGGPFMVLAGEFYMGIYTVSALTLLMLTSLGGLREYFRARLVTMPPGIGVFWLGLGSVMIVTVLMAAAQLPKPALPPVAYVDEHQTDFWSRNSTFQLSQVSATPVQLLQQSQFMDRLGKAVLIGLGLFLAYAALKGLGAFAARVIANHDRYPRFVVRFFRLVSWLITLWQRRPSMPKKSVRRRVQRNIATSAKYRNSMGQEELARRMNVDGHIEYAYQALCALAYDLGVPRQTGQTPYEFIESFPAELEGLREEAFELTRLYVISAYSPERMNEAVLDRLRKFWVLYDRVRNRVLV